VNGSFSLVTIGDYTHLVEKEKTSEIILSQLLKQKFYWQAVLFLLNAYDETVNDLIYYELIKVTFIKKFYLIQLFFNSFYCFSSCLHYTLHIF